MAEKAASTYTYEAYLELEKDPDAKYEYHDGMITAMAGGTLAHALIQMNLGRALGNELEKKGNDCLVFSSDAKIHIEATNRTYYPDLSVVCGEAKTGTQDPHALLNPTVVIEVLSDSTEAFDRGAKFRHYRELESLRQYFLISQHAPIVDIYYRTDGGTWEFQTVMGVAAPLPLKALGCHISMNAIYRGVSDLQDPNSEKELDKD